MKKQTKKLVEKKIVYIVSGLSSYRYIQEVVMLSETAKGFYVSYGKGANPRFISKKHDRYEVGFLDLQAARTHLLKRYEEDVRDFLQSISTDRMLIKATSKKIAELKKHLKKKPKLKLVG